MRPLPLNKRFTPAPLALAAALTVALAAGHAPLVHAQSGASATAATPITINIPAQPLGQALNELARQANLQMTFPAALVAGKTAPAVSGTLTPQQALDRLLSGSGLVASVDSVSVVVKQAPPQLATDSVLSEVTVIGEAETGYAGAPEGVVVRRSLGTALFGESDLREVPFSVNVVGSTEIKNRQVSTFSQALANDPAVGNSYEDVIPYDTLSIRGFPISNFIWDGQVTWDAYTAKGVESVSQIEVLRGPAAFRYGFVAPGGVLNVVSKQPTGSPFTSLTTSVTDSGRLALHLDTGDRLGSEKQFGYRVNAVAGGGKLWLDNTKKKRQALAISTDYRVSPDLTLYANYEIDSTKSRGGGQEGYTDVSLDINGRLPDPIPDPRKQWQPSWAYSDITEQVVGVRLNWRFSPDWTLDTSLKHGLKNIESWGGVTWSGGAWQPNGDHVLSYNGYRWDPVESLTNLTYVQGKVRVGKVIHNPTAGFSYTKFKGDLFFATNNSAPGQPNNLHLPTFLPDVGPGAWLASPKYYNAQHGAFLSNKMDIGRLHPLVGLRWSQIDFDSPWSNGKVKNNKLTPMAGLSFDLNDTVTFYGSYSTGLEQGGRAPIGTANALQLMSALDTKAMEFGAKSDLLNGEATLDVALFHVEKTAAFTNAETNTYEHKGKQVHRGLEVIAKGHFWRTLDLSAGVTFLDAVLKGNPATAGNRPENVPKWRAALSADHKVDAIPGFFLNGLIRFTDSVEYNTPNKFRTDPYTVLNGGIRYETKFERKKVIGRFNIDNVTNQRYWANAFSWGGGRGAPRTAKASLEVQF